MAIVIDKVDVRKALRKSPEAQKALIKAISLAVIRDSAPYVPRRSGALRMTPETQSYPSEGTVIYGGGGVKYARVQYYGTKYKYTVPGTRAKWFEFAKRKNQAKWAQEGQEAVRRVING